MTQWLQKLFPPPVSKGAKSTMPVKAGSAGLPTQSERLPPPAAQNLPNATIIYGIGASLLFVAALFLLMQGRWFPGVVVLALGGCLTGFALHLLKHQD